MSKEVTFVRCDDWIAVYIDGIWAYEGHSIDPRNLLGLVQVPNNTVFVSDQYAEEEGMPTRLDQIPPEAIEE